MKARLTQGLVKEAIFNIIAEQICGASLLDLYAGEGGVGLAALERGAERVVFVETVPSRVRIIQERLKKMGKEEKGKVICGNVLRVLKRIELDFEIIFLDPPYHRGLVVPTLNLIGGHKMRPDSLVIAEHHYKEVIPPKVGDLQLTRKRRYGETSLSFYKIL